MHILKGLYYLLLTPIVFLLLALFSALVVAIWVGLSAAVIVGKFTSMQEVSNWLEVNEAKKKLNETMQQEETKQ